MQIYTEEQWEKDCTFKAKPGQEVSRSVYFEMRDVLPPLKWNEPGFSECFRVGEPYSHDNNGRAYSHAFGMKGSKYFYIGIR